MVVTGSVALTTEPYDMASANDKRVDIAPQPTPYIPTANTIAFNAVPMFAKTMIDVKFW